MIRPLNKNLRIICRFIVQLIQNLEKNVCQGIYFCPIFLYWLIYFICFRDKKTRIEPHESLSINTYKGGYDGKNEVIQTHPLVGWDISTVDSYDALMLRLHYQSSPQVDREATEVGQTLWLTTDVARQFISILEAGIAKIESGEYQESDYRKH